MQAIYHHCIPSGSGGLSVRSIFICGLIVLFTSFFSCSEPETVPADRNRSAGPPISLAPVTGDLINIKAAGIRSAGEDAKTSPADRGRFEITLKYITPVTDRQREVFSQAAARWQRIIIKDVPSITPVSSPIPSAFFGFPPVADIGETIDDVIIEVAVAPIDGPGRILGQAGPRFIRTSDDLTVAGVMFFDVADLAFLDFLDLFEEVIVHEMGHVLGFGTLWSFRRSLIAGTAQQPYYTGESGNLHWKAEGGTHYLPIENMGGAGTRFSHWRENVLNNELMTGFLNLGYNPISRISAGSMRDLGYGTAVVGESYDLEKNAPGVNLDDPDEETLQAGIHIAEREIILEPVGYVQVE